MLRKLLIFGEIGPPLFSASPLFPASDAGRTYLQVADECLERAPLIYSSSTVGGRLIVFLISAALVACAAAVADVRTDLATFRVPR